MVNKYWMTLKLAVIKFVEGKEGLVVNLIKAKRSCSNNLSTVDSFVRYFHKTG